MGDAETGCRVTLMNSFFYFGQQTRFNKLNPFRHIISFQLSISLSLAIPFPKTNQFQLIVSNSTLVPQEISPYYPKFSPIHSSPLVIAENSSKTNTRSSPCIQLIFLISHYDQSTINLSSRNLKPLFGGWKKTIAYEMIED